jgi:hypothetical protein
MSSPYDFPVLERPVPAAEIVVEDMDDDICLYRPDIDEVLVLNHSAGDVWRLADGTLRVPEIVEHLSAAYGTTTKSLSADVQRVIDDLEARGYLVDVPALSSPS